MVLVKFSEPIPKWCVLLIGSSWSPPSLRVEDKPGTPKLGEWGELRIALQREITALVLQENSGHYPNNTQVDKPTNQIHYGLKDYSLSRFYFELSQE